MRRSVVSECRLIIDREFKRIYREQPNLSIDEIMDIVGKYKPKPKHGGMYPYGSWAKAMWEYGKLARETYPQRISRMPRNQAETCLPEAGADKAEA